MSWTNLRTSVEHRLVVDTRARGHHHATTIMGIGSEIKSNIKLCTYRMVSLKEMVRIKQGTTLQQPMNSQWIRRQSRSDGHTPAKKEGSQEGALKGANQDDRFYGESRVKIRF